MAVRRVMASVVVIVMGATACTNSVADLPAPSANSMASTEETPEIGDRTPVLAWPDGSEVEFIDIGEDVFRDAPALTVTEVRSDESILTEDVHPHLLALDAEGRALVLLNSRDYFDAQRLEYTRTVPVAIWDDDGFTELGNTDPLVPDDPHRTAIAGSLVGDTALWTESYNAEGSPTEWRKFSQRLDGGEPVLLGAGHETHEMQWSTIHRSSAESHAVVNGRIAWNYAYEDADGMIHSEVSSTPIGGGDPEPETEQTMNVVSDGNGWLGFRAGTGPTAKDLISGIDALVSFGPGGATHEVLRIDMGDEVGAPWIVAGDGRFALWIGEDVYVGEADSRVIYRFSWLGSTEIAVSEQPFCGTQFAVAVSTNADGARDWEPYLLDLAGASAQRVEPMGEARAPLCAGEYLAWETSIDEVEELYRTVVVRWE